MKQISTKPYLIILLVTIFSVSCVSDSKEKKVFASVSADTKYSADWESLSKYKIPEWFQDAKFGIFIHWGAYSVPAFGSEWYPRWMYMDTATFSAQLNLESEGPNPAYLHHKKKWGDQKVFGYKDFIPMFKAEKFDASDWITLFKKSGAKYVVPVAEHHDGFAMYDSQYTRWKSTNMGPKRDILEELFAEGRKQDLKMGASSHFAFNWAFFNKKPHFDTMDPEYADFYGKKGLAIDEPVSEEFKELWWNRTKEIISKYQPDVLWMDFFIDTEAFKDYHPQLAAYYYNKGLEWGKEVVLQDKNHEYESFPEGTFVHDLERGKMSDIRKLPWQTDTSIGSNSWGYVDDWKSKNPDRLVDDLVDIVSKNGCMLLNVGPRPDGTIPDDQRDILLEMGEWLDMNGEAIFETRCWKVFGEGPTLVKEGYMSEMKENNTFKAEDIRFTTKGDKLYAIAMDWPKDGKMVINSLATGSEMADFEIKDISLLGSNEKLKWTRGENGLSVELPKKKVGKYAHVLSITI